MKLPWKKVVDTSTLKTCKHKNIEVGENISYYNTHCRSGRTVLICSWATHRLGSFSERTELKLRDLMAFIQRRIEIKRPDD